MRIFIIFVHNDLSLRTYFSYKLNCPLYPMSSQLETDNSGPLWRCEVIFISWSVFIRQHNRTIVRFTVLCICVPLSILSHHTIVDGWAWFTIRYSFSVWFMATNRFTWFSGRDKSFASQYYNIGLSLNYWRWLVRDGNYTDVPSSAD